MLSWVRKAAIACAVLACIAAGLYLLFTMQVTRAKKEYDAFRAEVVVPAMTKWQAAAASNSSGSKIEPLPVPDFSFAEKESILLSAQIRADYRQSLAGTATLSLAFLAGVLFVYQHAIGLRLKQPIHHRQRPGAPLPIVAEFNRLGKER